MVADDAISRASLEDIAYFAARRWPDETGRRLYAHLASSADSGVWVAKDMGAPIGIAFAHSGEDEVFCSELFVEPSFRGNGLGTVLLGYAQSDAGDRARSGFLDPAELAGLAVFARTGIAIQTPILRVSGAIPKEDALAAMAYGAYRFNAVPLDPRRHRSALDALDREVRGGARPLDHAMFAAGAKGATVLLDDECVGYVYVWPDGRVGPIVSSSAAYVTALFAFGLVALVREFGASWCSAGVPGTNLRILRAAASIGLKIDMVRLFASDSSMRDLTRYVGYHPLLF